MRVTTSRYEISGKNNICWAKLNSPEHNIPIKEKLIGTSSTLARGKSRLLPISFFTGEVDYIPMYPSGRYRSCRCSAITRQEGGIAASKVCLQLVDKIITHCFIECNNVIWVEIYFGSLEEENIKFGGGKQKKTKQWEGRLSKFLWTSLFLETFWGTFSRENRITTMSMSVFEVYDIKKEN